MRDRLVQLVEQLRAIDSRALTIVSAYRCPVHNHAVGGATNSMHMYGAAADLPYGRVTIAQAIGAKATGIGSKGDYAVHVDVRDGPLTTWTY